VFLGYKNATGKEKFAGSAFWISRPFSSDPLDGRAAYLVTAAHVIDDIEKYCVPNDKSVRVRLNFVGKSQDWIETPSRFWKRHPDYPRVDLAMLDCEVSKTMDHVAWGIEGIFGKGNLDTESDRVLELGDEICFPGLFHPHMGESRNIPIVRLGNIAALREENVVNRDGYKMDAYLVESRSIGGLSGSPVFVDLAVLKRSHQPTWGLMAAGSEMLPFWLRFKLIGVIHGHFDWEDRVPDVVSLKDSRLGINTGIAMMTPSEKILENLEHAMKTEKEYEKNKSGVLAVADNVGLQSNVTYQIIRSGNENPDSK
jgi:hypothetical protein